LLNKIKWLTACLNDYPERLRNSASSWNPSTILATLVWHHNASCIFVL